MYRGQECSSESIKPPEKTNLGVAQNLFDPKKETPNELLTTSALSGHPISVTKIRYLHS